jgi:hypothetical protein
VAVSPKLRARLHHEGYVHLDDMLAQERSMVPPGQTAEVVISEDDMRREVRWEAGGRRFWVRWHRHPRLAEWWKPAGSGWELIA